MNSPLAVTLVMQVVTGQWLVSAPELRARLDSASASPAVTILDARDRSAYDRGHVPGALRIAWKDYRDGWGRTGKLSPDLAELAAKLGALGIDDARPVVVYGDAHEGWGEEGRIAWMLHYLGHPSVRVLDGGYSAWKAAGGTVTDTGTKTKLGRFSPVPHPTTRASLEDVAAAVGGTAVTPPHSPGSAVPAGLNAPPVVLDVRPRDEWDGARHYWEPRTGHVPGAIRFDWHDLLDANGHLRESSTILPLLADRHVTRDRRIIVYCTGGVRSAEAFWLLRALGFTDVRNFDGSWYEWAFDKSKPVAVGGPDAP
ncbi:MAG: sulfurtransferase [Gemmatimonadaceae bacterium]